jgi:thymidylate synthase (FAD)
MSRPMPAVYLVARPQFDAERFLAFLQHENERWQRSEGATPSEEIVEAAGRICYMSFGDRQAPRSNAEYIAHLITMGHESVLEHVSWSFLVTGVSRAFTHQLVRHRVGVAFSQLSQQYHDESDATFVMPSQVARSAAAEAAWQQAVTAARVAYRELRDALAPPSTATTEDARREARRAWRSAARSILPNATETKLFMTANARALRHLLAVRGTVVGDEEMRQVMAQILRLVRDEAAALFPDFQVGALPDGSPIVVRTPPS